MAHTHATKHHYRGPWHIFGYAETEPFYLASRTSFIDAIDTAGRYMDTRAWAKVTVEVEVSKNAEPAYEIVYDIEHKRFERDYPDGF